MEEHRKQSRMLKCCKISGCSKHFGHQSILKGKFVVTTGDGKSIPGKSVSVQIYSTEVDLDTGKGKLSERGHLKHARSKKQDDPQTITYKIRISVGSDFGTPTALSIRNKHKKRFFLQHASIEAPNNHIIHFYCNSWVYPIKNTKSDRIFFSNTCYLPSQTPRALMQLRKEELSSLRGNGTGERKEWDRIYDYDTYNDFGDPYRPVLGASTSYPYPRRLRTGRNRSQPVLQETIQIFDPTMESQPQEYNLDICVPSDERCSPSKLKELLSNSINALVQFTIPEAKSLIQQGSRSFDSFEEIQAMLSSNENKKIEGWFIDRLKKMVPDNLIKEVIQESKKRPKKFPLPQIISENDWAWKDDEEFGRQMLAGVHPVRIQRLKIFPPKSKNGVPSSIHPADIEQKLEGLTIQQALTQHRLFILDHHDYLMPFLNLINTSGGCACASRTLLFLTGDGMMKPIAIELSLPDFFGQHDIQTVFLPAEQGIEAALWQLAKAHVAANDSVYHQLISHWLHTHAVVEPFIIATRRQLSVMHPIHRLLSPHFKDTMLVNAFARSLLINSGGILEYQLFSGEFSMELSSELYKEWRFDEQGLPADLLKRGMALEDKNEENPYGIQLLLPDYPYACDGLEIWFAIKKWVKDFCSIFYEDDNAIKSDIELQAWWLEIQNVGHGDKHNETWWYQMNTLSNLVETLTTLIWIASAFHASLNYGQHAYYVYPPNRPTLCRKFVPDEGTLEFAELLKDPDRYFLQMLPDRFGMSLAIALADVLSRHSSDEVYLGCPPSSEWIDNNEVRNRFAEFSEELKKIQTGILKRNRDPKLKNRHGPAKIAYTLLYPDTNSSGSEGGITGRGIPNSISI